MVDCINESEPLEALPNNISDQGKMTKMSIFIVYHANSAPSPAAITGMALSKDGAMLASLSNIGAIKIWDIENDFKLLRKLRDNDEDHIDEFYCGKFLSESQGLIAAGGNILPCPIKVRHNFFCAALFIY
jgi:WD40 repeat protein